ncbi:oligoribonuclease [Plesiocystis pacifica SIR-1]|uniref:Oligoribonuclease n=1 Tax=Plesiocystis pacifica SIR-1 TaxID=391625 RepID=A6GI80_9BACT|nr:oligoribonuclease [Plesiocystis pacifica]EDM74424.1 oligoribonuclease [Plesiocystis pacifica SIR-1]
MADAQPHLIWLDMEMTGLDPEREVILEVATLVTNAELEIIAEGPDLVVHHGDAVLDGMDAWCTEHHGASGLTQAVRESSISLAEAEAQTLDFLRQHCEPGKSPLCGNSIGQDRRFIVRYMPALDGFLHYRSVDVSSIKELARRWYPDLPGFEKSEAHRALDDIRESIGELRHYRRHVFR